MLEPRAESSAGGGPGRAAVEGGRTEAAGNEADEAEADPLGEPLADAYEPLGLYGIVCSSESDGSSSDSSAVGSDFDEVG